MGASCDPVHLGILGPGDARTLLIEALDKVSGFTDEEKIMGMLAYKGYLGSIEWDVESKLLHGKILFVSDLVTYEAKDETELCREFEAAVEDHVTTCKQLGRKPPKPFSGQLSVKADIQVQPAAIISAHPDDARMT